ncbi:hypothetical protein EVAR_3246_1 [Eumeta japonica]|uniref:Uncharacterized protein n=1 Tax=Eumeta variegata TaxID=151549 RepID=A0A4C1SVQ3_EUMVA|nr:hypothetical protein EVAR_3246_1 [Eumeta japonica]
MCDCLVGERDDHETEIRSVVFMITKLKGELAELDVKCNDLSDQHDRLQKLVNETEPVRDEINILTLASQYIYENLVYVKRNIESFQKRSDIHNMNTRHKNDLAAHKTRLNQVNKLFNGLCVRFYNKIPAEIQNLSFAKFKRFVKRKLYGEGYYTVLEYLNEKNPWD